MTLAGPPTDVIRVTFDQAVDLMADHLLADADPATPHFMFGPVVWKLSAGRDQRQWYFIATSSGGDGFWCDQIGGADKDDTLRIRNALTSRLAIRRRPLVIRVFDDELDLARCCEAAWPCPKITEIRMAIEAERND
jgi:hypothetical protein